MVLLTPADVQRWDPDAIHGVFQTASNRAATLQTLGDNLALVHNNLSDWHGDAGDAFRADLGKTRRDIDADGQESKQVAAAVSRAEADVRAVKSELDGIEQTADGYGLSITADWRIDPGMGAIGFDKLTLAAEEQLLQGQLDNCKLHAHTADQELANAVRGAVGEAAVGAGAPVGQPKTWQDMLLPAGPASAQLAGDPAKGPAVPAGAGSGEPASLQDMLLGKGTPADQKAPQGDPIDVLSRVPPGATAIPATPLKPAEIEQFKAMARQSMINDGVPPEQIEAKLNAVVANTQQWLEAGSPKYVAPEPPRPPPPGFGEGFGDRWNSTVEGIQNLVGANGLDPMGEAWGGMAKGLGQKAEEYLTLGPVAPIADAAGELKSFMDNPSYYLGGKVADGALSAPAMMFGPEAAGIGEVGEIDAYAGLTHPPNVPIGLDNPTAYHPWAESAAQDLYSSFTHGEPTATLSQHLADMATHYVGDAPDRVVLGKFEYQDGGYIGDARSNGGIFFDTSQPVWDTMTQGLNYEEGQALGWQVNENFLRTQMESGVSRIDYVIDPSAYSSVEDVLSLRPDSFSAKEITFLKNYAEEYGYQQVGDSWIRVADGVR